MRDDTKLARIRKAMLHGDWETALRLAARFQRLGEHAKAIRRAADTIAHPLIYQQMGLDLEKIKNDGIVALKERFNKSWEEVKKLKSKKEE